jgi:N6-adenosine-specific RNA methylase IME4
MSFQIIYADPAWQYQDSGCNGAAAKQYATLDLAALCGLPVEDIAAPNACLFLWATNPLLPEAIAVMTAWGFKYKSVAFTWIKTNRKSGGYFFGLGRWTRGNSEVCLLGVKGKPKRVNAGVSSLIVAPVMRHSAKPPEARDRIVKLCGDLPRIELFARERTEGWVALGNEIDGKDIRHALDEQIANEATIVTPGAGSADLIASEPANVVLASALPCPAYAGLRFL